MITETPDYIPSKPCEYKGINYRSKLEARWAEWFDQHGIVFKYEEKSFNMDGLWYCPDFYISERGIWLEVKGFMDDLSLKKITRFVELIPEPLYLGGNKVGKTVAAWRYLGKENGDEAWWKTVTTLEPRLKTLEKKIKQDIKNKLKKKWCTDGVLGFYCGRKEGSFSGNFKSKALVGWGAKVKELSSSAIYDRVIDFLVHLYPDCNCPYCHTSFIGNFCRKEHCHVQPQIKARFEHGETPT